MSNLPNQSVTAPTRDSVVQTAIETALDAIRSVDYDRKDASDALKGAQGASASKRVEMLTGCATASIANDWTNAEIETGVNAAVAAKKTNEKDNSLSTFAGEIKRACHPNVRSHVAHFFTICNELWAEEKAAVKEDKDAPCPLSTAFAREYQLANALMSCAKGNEKKKVEPVVHATREEIIAFAVSRDPAIDAANVAKRLARITETLAEFAKEFPHAAFPPVDKLLRSITAKELVAVQVKQDAPVATSAPVAPVAPVVSPVMASTVTASVEPLAGAVDLSALNGGADKLNAALETITG